MKSTGSEPVYKDNGGFAAALFTVTFVHVAYRCSNPALMFTAMTVGYTIYTVAALLSAGGNPKLLQTYFVQSWLSAFATVFGLSKMFPFFAYSRFIPVILAFVAAAIGLIWVVRHRRELVVTHALFALVPILLINPKMS